MPLLLFTFVVGTAAMTKIDCKTYGSIPNPQGTGQLDVTQYTLSNGQVAVDVITYGSTITSVRAPSSNGSVEDIALGFDDIYGFTSPKNQYLGATIGRVANRIANGAFSIDGVKYNISKNFGTFTLHGGVRGLDKYVWDSEVVGDEVVMTCLSPDGDMGFPGELRVKATYSLDPDNSLNLKYEATTTKKTPVNIVNHIYLNLAGQGTGAAGVYEHEFLINSDKYTKLNEDSIPTGELVEVKGTPYDFNQAKNLGQAIKKKGDGYDINYEVRGEGLRQVALVKHPQSGRTLDLWSDQPGVQFYTSNFLGGVPGKKGVTYEKHGAFCLETQAFPDAANHPNFPSSILLPGQTYLHRVSFRLGVAH